MIQKYTFPEKQKFDKLLKNKQKETEIEEGFYKKTEKYLRFIKWIPGLRMVGIGNSISMNSATKDSDIDLLIVTDKNKMWFLRILVTFIFQILWVRKNDKNHAGRFCLSFFCEIEWLDFKKFALDSDPYLYFWILYFKPILDYWNTYDLFIEKNKSWADFSEYSEILESNKKYIKYKENSPITAQAGLSWFFKSIHLLPFLKGDENNLSTEGFNPLNSLNNFLKKIFLPKTLKHYNKIGKPYWIIINDEMLKFHNWDIRKKIADKFD